MSDRKTRDQHRRKFQELIDPENRSKRFRGEGNNKDDITPSSGIGITPSSGIGITPSSGRGEITLSSRGRGRGRGESERNDDITLSRRGEGNDDVITPTSSNENITLSALSGAVGTISKNFEGIRKHLEVVMFQLIILINTIIIIYNLY
jgi:hypothetical protein